jgi:hypothetical protein
MTKLKLILLAIVSLLYTGTLSSQNVSYVDAWQDGNDIVINFFLDEPAFVNITCLVEVESEIYGIGKEEIKIVNNHYCSCDKSHWCSYRWKVLEKYDSFEGDDFVFKVEAVENITEETNEEQESDYKFFILPTYHYARAPQHAYGLMLGLVDKAGVYLKVHSSFQFQKDFTESYGHFFDGAVKRPELAGYVGAMFRLGCPLYVRAGVGGGYKLLLHRVAGAEEWVKNPDCSYTGVGLDGGLMLKMGCFAVSVGTNSIIHNSDSYWEFNAGLGVMF